jgi:hypothetical protein
MNLGLEIIYNGKVVAATTPQKSQYLVFGITALEDHDNISVIFERLIPNSETPIALYYSTVHFRDMIRIKVKDIKKQIEQSSDFNDLVNFIKLQEYNYLHKKINGLIIIDRLIGFKFCINDKDVKILLKENRKIGCTIHQNEKGIKLSIGATDKISDVLFKNKSWVESTLHKGDEISIELMLLDEETPYISENEYVLERAVNHEKLIADYDLLRTELVNEGILK